MRMTKTTTKYSETNSGTAGCEVPRKTGPLTGVIVLLVSMTILVTLSVGGDLLENGMTLSQDEISRLSSQEGMSQDDILPSCPMPATLRLSLPDLSKESEGAWI
jgi:hypothetical protein